MLATLVLEGTVSVLVSIKVREFAGAPVPQLP